jgi:DNA-binding transcriptional ArsR family regulator
MILPELLSDPIRARIYTEVLLNKETTAQQLMKVTGISRSTMSHHLSLFVRNNVLNVRVQSIGRPTKYYSINKNFTEETIIEDTDTPGSRKRRVFLESAATHLQIITNLVLEQAQSSIKSESRKRKRGRVRKNAPTTFVFSFYSDEDAAIWSEEFEAFQKRLRGRIPQQYEKEEKASIGYISFAGQVSVPRH